MTLPKSTGEYDRLIVSRHSNILPYLVELGLVQEDTPIVSYVKRDDIVGRHVIGVLPLRMAALCAAYTEVPLRVPYEERGDNLPLDKIRFYGQEPHTYTIKEITE